ncbi:MAG: ABC transporter ATP-binding protein/permease [Candidatus Adiutrix sp.]|jgi:subfamily B ATP-binding cassette protein MsbA|nr:ABC transporter ATP-binding protein/permease [Candidatus Adiutrix sp.]
MSNYLRLLSYIRPYLFHFIVGLICILGASASQLVLPLIIRDIIDEVFINKDMAMLNIIAGSLLVIYLLRGLFLYGQNYLLEYVAQKVIFDLRLGLFEAMIRLRGLSYFEKQRTGGLMSYYTNDIGALQGAIIGPGIDFIRETFVLLISLYMMIRLHWQLSLFLFISVPLIAVAVKRIGERIKQAGRQVLSQLYEFTSILQETISGIRVVKSFAREDHEAGRFEEQLSWNFKSIMKATRANAILNPVVEVLATVGIALIIWYGGREVIEERLTAGSLVAFLTYAVNLSNPIKRLSNAFGRLQQAQAGCERVFGALDFEPEVQDRPEAAQLPTIEGRVRFEEVCFSYESGGQRVINGLNFTAEPGQMVALVGHSGAGKSTLANLIMRFYDVSSGAITIDGLDLRSVTQKSLREQVGIVPQETVLFSGSIYDNIRYGRLTAGREEVLAAARSAHVTEFAEELPDGFEALVGERGLTLSGGQRQRVAIARAILKDPRILILDEATSALDTESERLVQDALDVLLKGRTSFVIAHRLSTIFKADVIMVLNHGRLVEHGPHQELLAAGGVYARLYQTQFRDSGKRAQKA